MRGFELFKKAVLVGAAILVFLVVADGRGGSSKATPSPTERSPELAELNAILGAPTDRDAILRDILDTFSADPETQAYCCGTTSCGCSGLGDCVGLWLSLKCKNVDGPDIQNGACIRDDDTPCTNDDCTCPS